MGDDAARTGEHDGVWAEIVGRGAGAGRLWAGRRIALIVRFASSHNQAGQSRNLHAAGRSATGPGRERAGLAVEIEGVGNTANVTGPEPRNSGPGAKQI